MAEVEYSNDGYSVDRGWGVVILCYAVSGPASALNSVGLITSQLSLERVPETGRWRFMNILERHEKKVR